MEGQPDAECSYENSEERPSGTDSLLDRLGFAEADELKALRWYAAELSAADDRECLASLVSEYQLLGERLVSSLDGREYLLGQIGLVVATARLRRDAGDLEGFLDDIGRAEEYAFNAREDDIGAALEYVPSIEIARILSLIGEDYGFDEQTIAEVAGEPYGQAFETAYGYLTQAGLDADEILSAFIKDMSSADEISE